MGCDLRPASRAAAVALTAALVPSVLLARSGALLSCPAPVLLLLLARLLLLALTPGAWLTSPGGPHAVGVVISCSNRAAAASSTASDAELLAANVRQHSWHSCRACTSHDKRTWSSMKYSTTQQHIWLSPPHLAPAKQAGHGREVRSEQWHCVQVAVASGVAATLAYVRLKPSPPTTATVFISYLSLTVKRRGCVPFLQLAAAQAAQNQGYSPLDAVVYMLQGLSTPKHLPAAS